MSTRGVVYGGACCEPSLRRISRNSLMRCWKGTVSRWASRYLNAHPLSTKRSRVAISSRARVALTRAACDGRQSRRMRRNSCRASSLCSVWLTQEWDPLARSLSGGATPGCIEPVERCCAPRSASRSRDGRCDEQDGSTCGHDHRSRHLGKAYDAQARHAPARIQGPNARAHREGESIPLLAFLRSSS